MARLVWTEGSIADLEHIRRYVTAFHPDAARRLATHIAQAAAALVPAPDGDVSEQPIVFPYLLRHRLHEGMIVIVSVRHSGSARIV